MYPTTEVRWFFAETIPVQTAKWFRHVGHNPVEGERTDHYLRLPEVDAVGVKWREGNLEVKRCAAEQGEVAFALDVTGEVAHWHKWSFGLHEAEVLASLLGTSDWIAVAKARRLHTYAVNNGDALQNVSSELTPRLGCELELSTVQAAGQTWWTVAFEAFGDEDAQSMALRRTVEHVLQIEGAPALPVAASASYPRWLAFRLFENS